MLNSTSTHMKSEVFTMKYLLIPAAVLLSACGSVTTSQVANMEPNQYPIKHHQPTAEEHYELIHRDPEPEPVMVAAAPAPAPAPEPAPEPEAQPEPDGPTSSPDLSCRAMFCD
jgi:hypothetical protein